MAGITTKIVRLRPNPEASYQIGYLASQQRLTYNFAVDVLNRDPYLPLHSDSEHTRSLLKFITLWRDKEPKANAPYNLQQAAATQAWTANQRMQAERSGRQERIRQGSNKHADLKTPPPHPSIQKPQARLLHPPLSRPAHRH